METQNQARPNTAILFFNHSAVFAANAAFLKGTFTDEAGTEKDIALWQYKTKNADGKWKLFYTGTISDKGANHVRTANNANTLQLWRYYSKNVDISSLPMEERFKYPVLSGTLVDANGQLNYVKVWQNTSDSNHRFYTLSIDSQLSVEERAAIEAEKANVQADA